MNSAFDSAATTLDVSALPAEKCPAGPVSTGVATLAEPQWCAVGVWEHPVGTSTDVEADEVFVVLSGSGRVTTEDGTILELRPGVVGVLAAGTKTVWEITEPLKKVWITPA